MIDSLTGSYQKTTFPTMRNFCLGKNRHLVLKIYTHLQPNLAG